MIVAAGAVKAGEVLDVDANGSVEAIHDGRLVVNYLFGMRGDALYAAAGSNPGRNSTQVQDYLAVLLASLDLDDNGAKDALSDALLVLRGLFGMEGDALTGGALGSGASRTDPDVIVGYLDTLTPITPVNDTGITTCSDENTNGLPCPVAGYPGQDAQYGRDVTHNDDSDGHAGFSFTKIGANGEVLPANATAWSCVRDNVTGRLWEIKTNDGGLHDWNDRYTWYSTDPNTNGGSEGDAGDDRAICHGYQAGDSATYCNTQAFVARVNAVGWCGYHDWRLPELTELRSLVSLDGVYPAINTGWFPRTKSAWYWSASPDAGLTDVAWNVHFANGSLSKRFGGDGQGHRPSMATLRPGPDRFGLQRRFSRTLHLVASPTSRRAAKNGHWPAVAPAQLQGIGIHRGI